MFEFFGVAAVTRSPKLLIAFEFLQAVAGSVYAESSTKSSESKAAAAPPVGSEPEVTTAVYGAWTLRCSRRQDGGTTPRICEVEQAVVPQGQQNPIAQIGAGRPNSKEDMHLTAILPTNITFKA